MVIEFRTTEKCGIFSTMQLVINVENAQIGIRLLGGFLHMCFA